MSNYSDGDVLQSCHVNHFERHQGYCKKWQHQHGLDLIVLFEFPVPTGNIPSLFLNYLCHCTLNQGYCNQWQHQHGLDLIILFEFPVPIGDIPLLF